MLLCFKALSQCYCSHLKRPPQCWHCSSTQPGSHTQLPLAGSHRPFTHGLLHSLASAAADGPASPPRAAEMRIKVHHCGPRRPERARPSNTLRLRPRAPRTSPAIRIRSKWLAQLLEKPLLLSLATVITPGDVKARFLPLLAFAMTVLSDFYLSSTFTS